MTVNPGFGGQTYLPSSTSKISKLHRMLVENGLEYIDLEVDGGINVSTVAEVVSAGANVLVAGSSIFNSESSPAKNLTDLRAAAGGVSG
jgi:ribulose-phosphate 3-epimerase